MKNWRNHDATLKNPSKTRPRWPSTPTMFRWMCLSLRSKATGNPYFLSSPAISELSCPCTSKSIENGQRLQPSPIFHVFSMLAHTPAIPSSTHHRKIAWTSQIVFHIVSPFCLSIFPMTSMLLLQIPVNPQDNTNTIALFEAISYHSASQTVINHEASQFRKFYPVSVVRSPITGFNKVNHESSPTNNH